VVLSNDAAAAGDCDLGILNPGPFSSILNPGIGGVPDSRFWSLAEKLVSVCCLVIKIFCASYSPASCCAA